MLFARAGVQAVGMRPVLGSGAAQRGDVVGGLGHKSGHTGQMREREKGRDRERGRAMERGRAR